MKKRFVDQNELVKRLTEDEKLVTSDMCALLDWLNQKVSQLARRHTDLLQEIRGTTEPVQIGLYSYLIFPYSIFTIEIR